MSVFFLDEPNLSHSDERDTLSPLGQVAPQALCGESHGCFLGLGSAEGTTTTWTGGYLTDQLTIEEGRKGTRQKELEGTG